MNAPIYDPTSPRRRNGIIGCLMACVALAVIVLSVRVAAAAPEEEVRATFERFVATQNAHDLKALESLLLSSPSFLWITRGTPVWGMEAALRRFGTLYEGTWRLEPDASAFKVTMLGDRAAQIYVPILFTIGVAGRPAQSTRFLMNMVLVTTPAGWRVSSILPIPASTR